MTSRFSKHFRPSWAHRDWERSRDPRSHGYHGPHGHHHHDRLNISPEQQALRSTAAEVARLFAIASRRSFNTVEKQAHLRAFLERSRQELSDMIYGTSPAPAAGNEQA